MSNDKKVLIRLNKKMTRSKIHKAVFTDRLKDIKNDVERVYFGNEFCENLIPEPKLLEKWYFRIRDKKKSFSLVTPFVTNYGIKRIKYLCAFLNEQGGAEVIFNDWGVFRIMREKFRRVNPVLGRLLTKQRRDPRILKILLGRQKMVKRFFQDRKRKVLLVPKRVPLELIRHYRASLINLPIFQKYLLSEGINRVEIDNLIWGMNIKLDKRIKASIYLPYGYITTTRMCGKLNLTYAACKSECKRYYFALTNKSLPVPIYAIGNTVFFKSKLSEPQRLIRSGIDRLVYQPKLPF